MIIIIEVIGNLQRGNPTWTFCQNRSPGHEQDTAEWAPSGLILSVAANSWD
jgi:hypothetical protein